MIGLIQNVLLRIYHKSSKKKLIIFLTVGKDIVKGGILSISSICKETIKLRRDYRTEVVMCTIPGEPALLKHTKFTNQNYIYKFSQVLSYFKNLESILIHIPEYYIGQFLSNVSNDDRIKLMKIKKIYFNIMLQNIELLSPIQHIEKLRELGSLTCTTAHQQYSTIDIRKKLGFPLHKLSTYVSPEQYYKKSYIEKEDLMIVSPDSHPKKTEVLQLLARYFPKLTIQIIKDLTYEKYKKIIARAKWALTFGEGLDGYFIEPIFSGAISFSVYNSNFFTKDFKLLRTVYDSYNTLLQNICADIKHFDDKIVFTNYQDEQYTVCCNHYSYPQYIRNLELYYQGDYTYK